MLKSWLCASGSWRKGWVNTNLWAIRWTRHQDTAGKARMNSWETFSYRLFYMDMTVLADQQELTYNSSVLTQGVVWKTCWKQWMIGSSVERERESGKSVQAVQPDDDDDDDVYIYIYMGDTVWLRNCVCVYIYFVAYKLMQNVCKYTHHFKFGWDDWLFLFLL